MHAVPNHKGARRAFLCALSVVFALVSGCDSSTADQASPTRSAPVAIGPSAPAPGPLCTIDRVRCGSAAVPGQATDVDYAVFSGSDPAKDLILVEPGGPGFDLFKRADLSFVVMPDQLRKYDLLMIREPWTATPPDEACLAGLRSLGKALSDGSAYESVTGTSCHLSQWTSNDYQRAIDAILAIEMRGLTGIVGQSYGALPAAAAAHHIPTAWLILNAPIAPSSLSGDGLVNGREAAFEAALDASYRRQCAKVKSSCSAKGTSVAAAVLSRMKQKVLKQRSSPLRAGDVELAIMAAAYDLKANESWLWKTLTKLPSIGDEDWTLLGRLADQLLQRSGSAGDISPRLAAYFAGVCQGYRGWTPAKDRQAEMNLLLRATAAECAKARITPSGWVTTPVRRRAEVCLYFNEQDTVASPRDAAAWKKTFPSYSMHTYRYSGHLSLDRAIRLGSPTSGCGPLGSHASN